MLVILVGWVVGVFCCFFFFKQKTAYEMRISDWSSDVCSSDLGWSAVLPTLAPPALDHAIEDFDLAAGFAPQFREERIVRRRALEIGRASCRERVCQYV